MDEQTQAGQSPAETTEAQGTDAQGGVEQGQGQGVDPRAFAARLAQEREKIRAEMEAELRQQQGQVSPLAPGAAVDWNQLNSQIYEAFMANPAGTLLTLAQTVAQQMVQPVQGKLQEIEFRNNLAYLQQRYPDLPQVAPVLQEIISQRPDLWQSYDGLELAYLAAKGRTFQQQAQQLVQMGRNQTAEAESAKAAAVPTSGEANRQASAASSPEQAVINAILSAQP